ncbi:MAG: hypothetical protein JWO37_1380 [Acidimicrobiales bacterium]|nr:hypothetical protein [Acidimicrobiales bacterium]
MGDVPDAPPAPIRFGDTARSVAAAARRLGLAVPVFVSPPRLPRVARSLRRRADGTAVVAVRLGGRTAEAVAADLVDGVVVANRLTGDRADAARSTLLAAARDGGTAAAA